MTGAISDVGAVLDGKYRIERVIGEGGFGFVLQAEHLVLRERVAIKMLRHERMTAPHIAERFLREARSVARLRGEHVVRVLDVGTSANAAPYIVMEYLRGTDLADVVGARGPLPIPLAVECIRQACAALAEAHALGIVHRDIKPSNLYLTTRSDGSPCIKVLDFGIAKAPPASLAEKSITRTQDIVGTPLYMPPEQMRSGKIADPRIDVWALGATLYELLSGRPAFDGDSLSEICARVCSDAPQALPHLPPALWSAIERCLEKNPQQRFHDVDALAAALAPFRAGAESSNAVFIGQDSELADGALSFSRSFTVVEKNETRPLPHVVAARRRRRWLGATALAATLAFGLTFGGMALTHRAPSVATAPPPVAVDAPPLPVTALPDAVATPLPSETPAPLVMKPAKKKMARKASAPVVSTAPGAVEPEPVATVAPAPPRGVASSRYE